MIPIALAAYTVRDQMEKDYAGTVEKVAAMGYEGIEIGGFGPFTTAEWQALLRKTGLKLVNNHFQISLLEESLSHALEFNLALGNANIAIPNLPEERRKDGKDFETVAPILTRIGRTSRQKGARLHYHNHSNEFRRFGGKYALDILRENTEPGAVWFELDTYWIQYGGEDPVTCMKRFSGRSVLLHFKDMLADKDRSFAEVGKGILDFPAIVKTGADMGAEWFIVEQDICAGSSLESARISLENLRAMKRKIGV